MTTNPHRQAARPFTRIARVSILILLVACSLLVSCALPTDARARPTDDVPWRPAVGISWQIQLQGEINTSVDVELYVIDLFDTPQSTIDALHAQGRRVVCYFSAGSWEEWRDDASDFPPSTIGAPLADWPGEYWLDIRQAGVREVIAKRLDVAVQRSCDGVDPDNVNAYSQTNSGFPLTAADQLDFNRWLAQAAHDRKLAVGLKNDLGQIPQLVDVFDWVLNEQCYQYDECDLLIPFITAGKPALIIEYQGDPAQLCPQAETERFSLLFKELDLLAPRVACSISQARRTFIPLLMQ